MMQAKYIIPVFLACTILLVILVFAIISYVIIHRRKQHENDLEFAAMEFEHTRKLLVARLEEQEVVMTQISKEIHDNVAQKIDLLHMTVKDMDDAGRDHFLKLHANCKSILQSVTNDLRNISYSLDGNYIITHGLEEVLEKEVTYIRDSRKIDCKVSVTGTDRTLPEGAVLLIYRISQEALHNIIKHANATLVRVALSYQPGRFTMSITDNGQGFNQENEAKMSGLGLKNMQQRAVLMGAELRVSSDPGKGCIVSLGLDTHKSMVEV